MKRKRDEKLTPEEEQLCSILATIALRVARERSQKRREGLDGEMGKEPISPSPKGFSKKKTLAVKR